jgi:hypothetical protein
MSRRISRIYKLELPIYTRLFKHSPLSVTLLRTRVPARALLPRRPATYDCDLHDMRIHRNVCVTTQKPAAAHLS